MYIPTNSFEQKLHRYELKRFRISGTYILAGVFMRKDPGRPPLDIAHGFCSVLGNEPLESLPGVGV